MNKVAWLQSLRAEPHAAAKFKLSGLFFACLSVAVIALPSVAHANCADRVAQSLGFEVDELIPKRGSYRAPGPRIFVALSDVGQSEVGAINRLAQSVGVQSIQELAYQQVQIWDLPPMLDVDVVIELLTDNELISYAEADEGRNEHASPNDSLRCHQWYVKNLGSNYYGRESILGADLKLSDAWDLTTGSEKVIIALIDDGVDLSHPDLTNNLWVNLDEIPGNGIDDDLNGFVDDVHGWDFNRDDNDPSPEVDGPNHGTAVAGTFGAVGNNSEGIAGANWSVSIMVLKTDFSVSSTVRAMEYAANNGAKIVNTSFGGTKFLQSEYAAIDALRKLGVLVVASAGNEHWDNDFGPNYPGSYDLPNIIAVAATSPNDEFTPWTQHGQLSVDVAAPGDVIITTQTTASGDSGYAVHSGTSFSSPLVAGVAGLIKSQYPSASFEEIKARIFTSVDAIADAECAVGSGGRVNALAALEVSKQPVPVMTGIKWADGNNHQPDPGESAVIKLEFETLWGNADGITVTISSDHPAISLLTSEVSIPSLRSGETYTIEVDAKAAADISGHNRVPLTMVFSSPGFTTERTVCLIAAPLVEGQSVEAVLQTSALDDMQRYHIQVPENVPNLKLHLDSNHNVDLYARFGNWPQRDQVLRSGVGYAPGQQTYISAHEAGAEALDIVAPRPGTWYVMVVNAGQLSDAGYVLNNHFGREVNPAGTDQEVESKTEIESKPPVNQEPARLTSGGGGGGGGWTLLMLISILLPFRRSRGERTH